MTSKSIYHYVYRISNSSNGMHYYGVRSSKILPKLDLGVLYFSSSKNKIFLSEQKTQPLNFRYKIVRVLSSRSEAMELEIKLHAKFDVGANPKFYNLARATSTGFGTNNTKHTEETKQKLSMIGKTRSHHQETRDKLSEIRKNKTVHQFLHISGATFVGTKHSFGTEYNLNGSSISRLVKPSSKSKTLKGWSLIKT